MTHSKSNPGGKIKPKPLQHASWDLTCEVYNQAFADRGLDVPKVNITDNVYQSFLVAITHCFDAQQKELESLKVENRRIKTLLKKIKEKVDL